MWIQVWARGWLTPVPGSSLLFLSPLPTDGPLRREAPLDFPGVLVMAGDQHIDQDVRYDISGRWEVGLLEVETLSPSLDQITEFWCGDDSMHNGPGPGRYSEALQRVAADLEQQPWSTIHVPLSGHASRSDPTRMRLHAHVPFPNNEARAWFRRNADYASMQVYIDSEPLPPEG